MSKVVMSLPKGMVKNSVVGGVLALASYVALQFVCALLVDRGVLGMESLYPMVCVAAALASFLGCGYSVLRRREAAMLSVSAVVAVFLAVPYWKGRYLTKKVVPEGKGDKANA